MLTLCETVVERLQPYDVPPLLRRLPLPAGIRLPSLRRHLRWLGTLLGVALLTWWVWRAEPAAKQQEVVLVIPPPPPTDPPLTARQAEPWQTHCAALRVMHPNACGAVDEDGAVCLFHEAPSYMMHPTVTARRNPVRVEECGRRVATRYRNVHVLYKTWQGLVDSASLSDAFCLQALLEYGNAFNGACD